MPQNRQIAKAGFLYLAIVFGVGFLLGAVPTLWIVPQVGTRIAELMVIAIATARWLGLRFSIPSRPSARLGMGAIALGLLLFAEFGSMSWLRGISIRGYLATRDPVPGTVYHLLLVLFGLMPVLVARKSGPADTIVSNNSSSAEPRKL